MRNTRLLTTLLLALTLNACSWLPEQIDITKNWSANRLYSEGKSNLQGGDYEKAIEFYEKLEARYPFGRYAQQAQLETAYAYYKYDEPDLAITTLDRFIKTYPRHPYIDYAHYLKGIVNFNRGENLMDKLFPPDASKRDQGSARQAFQAFSILIKEFPESRYAADARQRMIYLRNNLAQYEVHVARYYMQRKAYVAAANRANYVVEHYQRTPAVPEALGVMVEAYREMEMDDLAYDALRVLQLNYPEHPALEAIQN